LPKAKAAARSILSSRTTWIWLGIWLATRGLTVLHVGFWTHSAPPRLEDVNNYEVWSGYLPSHHSLPVGESWQYPPGAAFLMLVPRLGPGTYGESFVGLMLLLDLVGLGLLALLGRRYRNYTGVWVWLLGMPLLGVFAVLRFDLVPSVIGIAALVVIHRRPHWFGALAGIGGAIKVWPLVLLLGEWDRRRLLQAVAAAAASLGLIFLVSTILFGDSFGFLGEQSGRGLQEEAVASVPWQIQEIVTGEPFERSIRFGAWEITSPGAGVVAGLLEWLSLAALAAAALWWWFRAKAIRAGATHLAAAEVSRDFVFAVVLLLVVSSRVLSPQYMVWLLGLAAVVLSAGTSRMARPAWIVIGATILSTSTFKSAENTLIRDLALLAATIDATTAMVLLLRRERMRPLSRGAPV
jgi:hypothetical protein